MPAYVDIHYGIEAMEHLIASDSALAPYVEKYGRVSAERNPDAFAVLVSCIIRQKLSASAATTVEERVMAECGGFTPKRIMAADPARLREAGLPVGKIDAIRNVAQKTSTGKLDLNDLHHLTDDEYVDRLSSLKGVDRWAAAMTAIFSEGRLDVFLQDDPAVRQAVMRVHGYTSYSKERYERLKKTYSPYGTVASLYYFAISDAFGNGTTP
jgi:3-methyladenine DNA glycosylase/8-oxoguanine DNA glycosylase